jgi:hypothetical protein
MHIPEFARQKGHQNDAICKEADHKLRLVAKEEAKSDRSFRVEFS